MTSTCQLCDGPTTSAVCGTCAQLTRGANFEALDAPTNPFDYRLQALAFERGITDPGDPRLVDVLNDFMAQLRAEGTAEEYNRLVMAELVDAGVMPLLTRIANKSGKRRKKKRRR